MTAALGWLLVVVGGVYVVAPKVAYVLFRSRTAFRLDPHDPGPSPAGPTRTLVRAVGAVLAVVGLVLVVVGS